MDERDLIILRELVRNARVSYVELSEKLGITEAAVRKRVKKLEETGVIRGFTANVDPSILGFNSVAIIGLDTRPDSLMSAVEYIRTIKNVRYVALSSGDHMIMFEIWCKDQHELSHVVDKVKKLDGVTKVCPAVLLKSRDILC